MSSVRHDDKTALDSSLARLEKLITALDTVSDAKARESARELFELLLDLHGLAFARVFAIVAATDTGGALSGRMVADPHVNALLLLHGLHPVDAKTRIHSALAKREPQWQSRGLAVNVISTGNASVRVQVQCTATGEEPEQLRSEVERTLLDAAPDLDEIIVEFENSSARIGSANRVDDTALAS